MLLYNLKLVFRNLVKNKLYSFLSITGFAIGFGVCIVIALYAYNEYTVDHCYPNYSRIYRLLDEKNKRSTVDFDLNKVLSDNNPEVLLACPMEIEPDYEFSVKSEKQYTKAKGAITTTNSFFKLFSRRILSSVSDKPFADKQSVVITESLAKKLFGKDENPLGKSIYLFNSCNATISAVVEDFPSNSSIKANVLLNSENKEFRFNTSCSNHKCINPTSHFILLDEIVNSGEFNTKLNHNISHYKFAIDSIRLQKLSDIYFDNSLKDNGNVQGNRILISVLLAIGVLIMFLSLINYLNYNISQQYANLRVIGIKRINGASISHIIGYYLIDVIVGILISVDIALICVGVFLSNISGLLDKQLSMDVLLTPMMLSLSLGVVILIIIINSIVPLFLLSKFSNQNIILGTKPSVGKLIGRSVLTTFQFMAAIALLSCVIIILKQIVFAQNSDLGFNKENHIKLSIPTNCTKQQLLKWEVDKLPFVIGSTLTSGTPGEIFTHMSSNDSTVKKFNLSCIFSDTCFVKTMAIELLDGRLPLKSDIGMTCLMNQEAIKQFGWKDIENKRFNNGRKGGFQVVGIVKNFHVASLHQAIKPVCIIFFSEDEYKELYNLSIRITSGEIESKMKQIDRVWKKIIPDEPMDFTFYDSFFDAMYRKEKLLATIIMFFSVIAILLSCMGILGQVFQTCINRTKEIGIRKVNGASTLAIIRMLNFDFVKLIIIAFVIACPLSYYIMNKWLQNFAYRTDMSWWIFALAGIVVLVISFVTVTWHSWRTASRNPVEALRDE